MKSIDTPLTDAELDELDDFLLNRGQEKSDDEYVEGQDEGILGISELDGFLTAIVSGPETIAPSCWVPAIWGDKAPVWKTKKQPERIFGLVFRHMNGIAGFLMDLAFEPLFLEREVEGKVHTIVDEWCEGYMRGVRLSQEAWDEAQEDIGEWLDAIVLFTTDEEGWDFLDTLSDDEVVSFQQKIPGAVKALHAYWLERRRDSLHEQTVVRSSPKVGRNDPCPCGSGKKFKKCCLN